MSLATSRGIKKKNTDGESATHLRNLNIPLLSYSCQQNPGSLLCREASKVRTFPVGKPLLLCPSFCFDRL